MIKFVYFLYGSAYEDCIINAVKENPNAFYFNPFKNGIVKKLHMIHNARPLNEKKELPLKTVWFKRAIRGMNIEKEDIIYFLLYESFHLSYSRNFLLYLREKFPKCKLCFMYLNPVTDLISGKLRKVSGYLDTVITFNKKDAEQYGLLFAPLQPYRLPICKDNSIPRSDVFFIGADKGRLPKLLAIYERLISEGLKCDFHIVGVSEDQQKYSDDIVYNQKIPYSEVLARVDASKCVLEVLQKNEDYLSIRTFEALQYHRKLLTESKSILQYEFYDPKVIQVFDEPELINTDFIKISVDEEKYSVNYPGDVEVFHRFLRENI